jgi:hypothetical protein
LKRAHVGQFLLRAQLVFAVSGFLCHLAPSVLRKSGRSHPSRTVLLPGTWLTRKVPQPAPWDSPAGPRLTNVADEAHHFDIGAYRHNLAIDPNSQRG